MRSRKTTMILAVLALAAASAARAVTIADLVASPDSYDGKTVTVSGRVELALPFGSEAGFELRDGPAKLTVMSRAKTPTLGSTLLVTGTIHVFHEGDGGPEENRFPPVMLESSRTVVP